MYNANASVGISGCDVMSDTSNGWAITPVEDL